MGLPTWGTHRMNEAYLCKNLFSRSRIKKCGCPRPSGNSALGCDDFTDRVGQELVKIDYSECQTYPFCPQDGGFSQWSTWSECDCHDLVQAFKSTKLEWLFQKS